MDNIYKLIIKFLVNLPSNYIINGIMSRLLDRVKKEVIKTRNGYYIQYIRTSPESTGLRKTVILGEYEKPYLNILSRLVKLGSFVIDVGAHEGYVSLWLSKRVGNNGRIFAIEPNLENMNQLRQNVELNSAENIVFINKAISDEPGKSTFYYNDGGGAFGALTHFPHFKNKKAVMVEVETLDNLFLQSENIKDIALCKLDIEGNEMKAIMGGERLISEYRPYIAFEVNLTFWAYHDVSIEVLFDFLRERRYELFVIKNNRLSPYEWLDQRIMNVIAIHDSRKSDILDLLV